MPTTEAVQQQLRGILVQVVDCAPGDVVPTARLGKDLGVDSLSMVEICEKLGQDFDVYISDGAINSMVTVDDAIRSITEHDGSQAPPAAVPRTAPPASSTQTLFGDISSDELDAKKRHAWLMVARMVIAGLAIGLVLAFAGVALINASGIKDIEPPSAAPTTSAPEATTAAPKPSPTATPSPTEKTEAPPTLSAEPTSASPGEQIVLEGTFEKAGDGATLQVQIKDPGTKWDIFPVTTKTGAYGEFRTIVRTTRTGKRQFRMLDTATDKTTPAVTVTIG